MKKIFVAFPTALLLITLIFGNHYYQNNLEKNRAQAMEYIKETEAKNKKIESIENSIYKIIPGIVSFGDSLTQGAGGEGVTYPNSLKSLISDNIYDIPVVNMGVGGETTNTIMARAGSIDFLVDNFTIPENTSKVEISISSSNGTTVAPLRQGDTGINPVIINGIEGTISIEQESITSKKFKYYFQRKSFGDSIKIKGNTKIELSSAKEYTNYLPIVFMGQNGGWDDNEDLIQQIESILNLDKFNEKYLVLGLTSGNKEDRFELEQAMETAFGDQYINLRDYISKNGLKIAGIEPTKKDKDAMGKGEVPPSLLVDPVHFNSDGYKIIAKAVYERMDKLGFFKEISEKVKEIEEL